MWHLLTLARFRKVLCKKNFIHTHAFTHQSSLGFSVFVNHVEGPWSLHHQPSGQPALECSLPVRIIITN